MGLTTWGAPTWPPDLQTRGATPPSGSPGPNARRAPAKPGRSSSYSARALWALAVLLPACAGSQEWIYEKPRTTPAQLDHDKRTCRKASPSRSLLRTFEDDKVEREGFNRCMEKLGYTITVVPRP